MRQILIWLSRGVYPVGTFILLCLLLTLSSSSRATVGVVKAQTGTTVYVCQPSDTNSNCGGGSQTPITQNVNYAGYNLYGAGSITGTSIVKTGGTASQFLKADGSVDSNTYLTTGAAASTYLSLAGGTLTGDITISTHNIVTDTTTGTKIGTSASQKLGFFNATPIVQPTGNICTAMQNLGLVSSCTEAGGDNNTLFMNIMNNQGGCQ